MSLRATHASAGGGPEDDGELIARIRAQDRGAFETLFHRYYRRVYGFLLKRLGDASLVEETVIDVFFEIWQNAGAFRAESRPSTWIFGIAHYKSLAARRHRSRPQRRAVVPIRAEALQRFPDERPAHAHVEARDQMRRLEQILRTLGPDQRQAAELVWIEGLSHEEAARRLGVTANAVKLRVSRARERVRREWQPALVRREGA